MPIYGSNNFGDLYGIVKLKMPKNINNNERKVLEDLKKKENFK
jgi:DnaJ-class molecular chaperone